MKIIGHRGACGYEPENTLRSFRKALDLGVDMIEFDVYTLPTGQSVILHDDTVDRTTNGTGNVMKLSFEELRKLDAGKGEKIPTLEEALDLIDKKTSVNIELKGEHTAQAVTTLIETYRTTKGWKYHQFLVSSFNHPELAEFHQLLPAVPIGALITGIPFEYAKFGSDLQAYSVNVSQEFVNQRFVDDAHRRGLKLFVFTVNDPDDINRMKQLGVDGIFTNYPDRAR